MAMNPEAKALWLAALRSGEYEQGRNRLAHILGEFDEEGIEFTPNGKVTYCCLGVLCEVAKQQGLDLEISDSTEFDEEGIEVMARTYDGVTGLAPGSVLKWAGLAPHVQRWSDGQWAIGVDNLDDDDDSYDIAYGDGEGKDGPYTLARANDTGSTFADIADIIEANF